MRARAFAAWRALERRLDTAFGPEANPLRHSGALAFFLFWVVALSGIYLYLFFDTSAGAAAWRSVERLSAEHGALGTTMRGLHRYGTDAMVLAVLAHLAREWLAGHEKGARRFAWLTGVPLVVLLYASGIGGFWLVWDERALFSLTATAEWFDWLGVMPEPFVRSVVVPGALAERLFTLFMFLHIGIPLLLLAGMWVHVQRLASPETRPVPALAAGTLAALALLSLAAPVESGAPAELARPPAAVSLDWFLLFAHALMYATSPAALWAMVAGGVLLLVAAPWLGRGARLPAAVVSPADCNGCGRCFADCPFLAVTLVPHPAKARAPRMAQVDPALCTGCGICAGACPSSTPFRASEAFCSGIDMPGRPIAGLRARLERALGTAGGFPRVVVYGCERGAPLAGVGAPDTVLLPLLCAGMLPPSFVEYALRYGADGVLVSGCEAGGCDYRFGQRWLEARLAGLREPRLRANVPRERLAVAWTADAAELEAELERFRARLRTLGPRRAPARPKRAAAATR